MLNVVPKISVILTMLPLVFRLCHTVSASWNWGLFSDTRRLIGPLIGHITTEPDVSYILYQHNITFFSLCFILNHFVIAETKESKD